MPESINADGMAYPAHWFSDAQYPYFPVVRTPESRHDRAYSWHGYTVLGAGPGLRVNRYNKHLDTPVGYRALLSPTVVDKYRLALRHGEYVYGYEPAESYAGFRYCRYSPATGAIDVHHDRFLRPERAIAPNESSYSSSYLNTNAILCVYRGWLVTLHIMYGEIIVRCHSTDNLDVHVNGRDLPELEWMITCLDRYLAGLNTDDTRGWIIERAPHDKYGMSRKFYVWPRYPNAAYSIEDSSLIMYFDLDADFADVCVAPGIQFGSSGSQYVLPRIVRPSGELVYFSGKRSVTRYDPYKISVTHIAHGLVPPKTAPTPRFIFSTDSSFVAYYYVQNEYTTVRWAREYDFEEHTTRTISGAELNAYCTLFGEKYYPYVDDSGFIYQAPKESTTYSVSLISRPASLTDPQSYFVAYLHQYLMTDGLYFSDERNLGFQWRQWDALCMNELASAGRYIIPGTLVNKSELDVFNVLDVTEEDEGKYLKVVGGHMRKVADPGFRLLPTPETVGQVLGVDEHGGYAGVPFPKTLPDWFNGCTPVVQPGGSAWQAGDILEYLPKVRRSNVIMMSKDRRWEPAVMPFTTRHRTLEDAFPALVNTHDLWFIYADSTVDASVSDVLPNVGGYTPGMIRRHIPSDMMRLGVDSSEIALIGNLNNKLWDGVQTYFSNRDIRNWDYVRNTGMGRWRVGDFLDTSCRQLDERSDSWFESTDQLVVCRVNNYEPGCRYGEEHKELYFMLGRFMGRQFMKGAIPQDAPCRYECETATNPEFTRDVNYFDTDQSTTGWQFEHTDGGQSAFIPTGPAGTTVIGVVFDPLINGVQFDQTTHYFRYRKTVNGVSTDWQSAEMFNLYNGWFDLSLVEDQRYVNHVVLPELAERGWVYTRKPVLPVGGACVYVEANVPSGVELVLEAQVDDSIVFTGETYGVDSGGWFVLTDAGPEPYTGQNLPGGATTFMFSPEAALVESRVGSRFFRWRWKAAGGEFSRWGMETTFTTFSNQYRFDMLNVLGFERDRAADGVITMVRDAPQKTVVTSGGVYNTDAPADEKGYLSITTAEDGPAVVLAHGVYDLLPDAVWKYEQAMSIAARRSARTPPLHESKRRVSFKNWYDATASANNNTYRHPMGKFGSLTVNDATRAKAYVGADVDARETITPNRRWGLGVDVIPGSELINMRTLDFIPDNLMGVNPSALSNAAGSSGRMGLAVSEDNRFIFYQSAYRSPNVLGLYDVVLGTQSAFFMSDSANGKLLVFPDGLFHYPTAGSADQLSVLEPRTGIIRRIDQLPLDEHRDLTATRALQYTARPWAFLPGRGGLKYYQGAIGRVTPMTRAFLADSDADALGKWFHEYYPDYAVDPTFDTAWPMLSSGDWRMTRSEYDLIRQSTIITPVGARHAPSAAWGMAWLTYRRDPCAYVNAHGYRAVACSDWSGLYPLNFSGEWFYSLLAGDYSVVYTTNMTSRLYADSAIHSLLRGYTQAFNIDRDNSRTSLSSLAVCTPNHMAFSVMTDLQEGGAYYIEYGEPGSGLSDYRGENYVRLAVRPRFGR